MPEDVYNPLDKLNLARSIETELLKRPPIPLASVAGIEGAGVYVIYYTGAFKPYEKISLANQKDAFKKPIYVGKAIPKGGRKGGVSKDSSTGKALSIRLKKHAASVSEAGNLNLGDFHVRYLIVDDIWIPLGENMLIETFEPIWNKAIDGFGNNDPGQRRKAQYKSPWDVLHPGRSFAVKLADGGMTIKFLGKRVKDYLANKPLDRLPKEVAKEQESDLAEAEEDADKV